MKKEVAMSIKRLLCFALFVCLILSPLASVTSYAIGYRSFNPSQDIDYTAGEGGKTVLTHKTGESAVTYSMQDSRMTRNCTFYMSMKVNFEKSHSWAIEMRNLTCQVDGEEVTGNLEFRLFGKEGTLRVAGKTLLEQWPKFSNIGDKEWHEVTVCSSPDSFMIWIDGVRAKGVSFKTSVKNMTTNYISPSITLAGENIGTVKDICIWNNGTTENPIMPADRVVQSIEALPSPVEFAAKDIQALNTAIQSYQSLNAEEKSFVWNYSLVEQLKAVSQGITSGLYDIAVSGDKEGNYKAVFPKGVISQTLDSKGGKYYFETPAGRKHTYYTQFVINMTSDTNCFDVFLRNQEHNIEGKKVSGMISIRMFKTSAVILDSDGNKLSEWISYPNIYQKSHVVMVESSPTRCVLWIDGVPYEFPKYQTNLTGSVDCIQAVSGFSIAKGNVQGTISDARIWSASESTYSVGDAERIAISNLPELNELSLSDKESVENARQQYECLKDDDKKYVTNIKKLESLERAISFLEEDEDLAYMFLKDELPQVKEDYVNLISTGKADIAAKNNSKVTYNANTHDISFLDATTSIPINFPDIKGIDPSDTWMIKFNYTPHEYYYAKKSDAWMGLHIVFSQYETGGYSESTKNLTEFIFFVNQSGFKTTANSVSLPATYIPGFEPELGKTHQVTMLCVQGKLKVWVNGETVAYLDDLPEYPMRLGFTSSNCRCDVTNIQIYNMSDPTVADLELNSNAGGFKIINDLLYDVTGEVSGDFIQQKQQILLFAIGVASVIVIATTVLTLNVIKRKKQKGVMKDEK